MLRLFRRSDLLLAIIGLLIIFVSLNIIVQLAMNRTMLDMTDDARYSLSAYSKEQAKQINNPLYITVYYSQALREENPKVARYAEFVLRFLQQYKSVNPDKIFITVKNPEPYSETEKEAKQAGLMPFPSADGQTSVYFGAVFRDSENMVKTIPYFSSDREFWLEKDITIILAQFNMPERKVIGLISPLHKMITREYGKGISTYALVQELSAAYDILPMPDNVSEIPLFIETLLVVAPNKMPDSLMYALDQYVMRGGNLIMLADSLIEEVGYKVPSETLKNLNKLLNGWGVRLSEYSVGSQKYGRRIFISATDNERRQEAYPLWLDLKTEVFNQNADISKGLSDVSLKTPLEILPLKHDESIQITPLISIEEGAEYFLTNTNINKKEVIETYHPEEKPHWLAAEISGKFRSMFMSAPISAQNNQYPFLYYSVRPAQIMLVGESDFICDDVWLENGYLNDNGQFVLKAIEKFSNRQGMAWLYKSQTKELSDSLGNRIYRQIYDKYASKISRLQDELSASQEEYEKIRQSTQKIDAYTASIINRLKDKIKEAQTRLKYYNYDLKRSFDSKIQSIIFINIVIFPLSIILLLFFGYKWIRRYQKKKIKEKFDARQ